MKLARLAYAYTGVIAASATMALGPKVYAAPDLNSSSIGIGGNADFSNENIGNFKEKIAAIASTVLDVVLLLSGILAVFYLIYSGIQYITSAGSPEKTKTARAGIINAVIGIIIIVSAFFIIRVALSIANTAANSG